MESAYSTDGNVFTKILNAATPTAATYTIGNSSLLGKSFNLSSVSELDDQEVIYFRLAVAPGSLNGDGNPIQGGGTSKLDIVTIKAAKEVLIFTPIPEPSVVFLGAMGVLGMLRRRR